MRPFKKPCPNLILGPEPMKAQLPALRGSRTSHHHDEKLRPTWRFLCREILTWFRGRSTLQSPLEVAYEHDGHRTGYLAHSRRHQPMKRRRDMGDVMGEGRRVTLQVSHTRLCKGVYACLRRSCARALLSSHNKKE